MKNSQNHWCTRVQNGLSQHLVPGGLILAAILGGAACWWFQNPHGQKGGVTAVSTAPQPASAAVTAEAKPAPQVAASGLKEPESFWQAFAVAQHKVQTLTEREAAMPQNRGVRYFAANPGQQLTARFLDTGVRIESGAGGGWQGTLGFSQVSRGGQSAAPAGQPVSKAQGARVEYQHGGMVEWYENRTEGFEHGFTLTSKPVTEQDDAPLRVEMKFAGLKAMPQKNGRTVKFANQYGAPVVTYKELKVWDAKGKALSSHLEAKGDQLAIVVADAGATYPVTIDPIIASLEQKLGPEITGSGAPEDRFGTSVALDGNTAVISAPGDDTAIGMDAGSAFIFVRTGAIWTLQARVTASDAAANDGFGASVAISANTVVVGQVPIMMHPTGQLPQFPTGSAYVFVRSGNTWTQQAILAPTEPSFSFGTSVAVSADTAVVGDTGFDRAIVFVRSGTAWTQQQVLIPTDQMSGMAFGASVSISGDTAFVGAPLASDNVVVNSIPPGIFKGAAYAFVRSGTAWSEQQKLPGANPGDFFGGSVSVLGNRVIIGAIGFDTGSGQDAGGAFLYSRNGTNWSSEGNLVPSDGSAQAGFGSSVSLGTDRALVGAPHENGAYIFEPSLSLPASQGEDTRSVSSATPSLVINFWQQKAKLTAGDAVGMDFFGGSVSLSGDTALIGTPYDQTSAGSGAGSAYVFVYGEEICCGGQSASDYGGWCQQDHLTAGDAALGDFFGRPLATDGNTALVGAQRDDTPAGVDIGSVYVFVRNDTVWTQQARVTPSDAVSGDGFGRALALSGNLLVATSPNANSQTGAAYVFARTGSAWKQSAKLLGKNGLSGDSFGRSAAMTSNTIAIGAFTDDTPAGDSAGSVFVFTLVGKNWNQQAQLFANDAAPFDLFGQSVSLSGQTLLVGAMGDDATAAGQERGAAYVFVRSGVKWNQQAKLVPDDVANLDFVGHSVSLFENTALISADGADTPAGSDAGAAYIFTRTGTSWTQQQKLVADDAAAGDGFGRIVALVDGLALIGAPQDDTIGGSNAGSAYVFARQSGLWQQQVQLLADDGNTNDLFGWGLALSPTRALVGADSANGVDPFGDPVPDQGRVYVFNLLDTTPPEIAVEVGGVDLVDAESAEFGASRVKKTTVKAAVPPVSFGSVVVGMSGDHVFITINEGGTLLTGLRATIDGPNRTEFKLAKPLPLTLGPKGETTFVLTFAPTGLGPRNATLRIASNDSDENPFDIPLQGTGAPPIAPTISALEDRLVPANTTVKFAPTVTGAPPPVITWKRNNAVIPKAKSAVLSFRASLPLTGASNAGLYVITATNSAGTASEDAELGIVDTSTKKLILPTTKTATMTVRAAGNGLSFVWFKDGSPLSLDSRIKVSANGKTLTVANLELGDAGTYYCEVTGPGGALIGGTHELIVIDMHPGILEPVNMPNGKVGVAYKFTIPIDPDPIRTPTSFGAVGLPNGLTVNKDTGDITGKPKASGMFNVTLSASNYWGTTTAPASLFISPAQSAPCGVTGTFNGLVNRDGGVNGGFGGIIVLTVDTDGGFTGHLTLAGVKYPFAGDLKLDGSFPTAKVTVKRTVSGLGPLTLQFTLDEFYGTLNGTVTDSAIFPYQISDLAGSALVPDFTDGKGTAARFNGPHGLTRDKAGNLYVADTKNHVIRKIDSAGNVTTIGGMAGYCGSTDGTLDRALFHSPQGVAVDAEGNVYVADTGNSVIRKIGVDGKVTTVAGSAGFPGSVNGTGTAARFICPVGIVIDSAGNLLVSDKEDHTIRKVTPAGVATLYSGKAGTPGAANGSPTASRFNAPKGLALTKAGVLLVADSGNHAIRAVSKTGATSTFAGALGVAGSADGLTANARFHGPSGVAVDTTDTVFVADTLNCTLRRINSVGIVSTVAGKVGVQGVDPGLDGAARFTKIYGLALNGKTVYITDAEGHIVRVGVAKPSVPVPVLAYRNPWGTDTVTPRGTSSAVVLTNNCYRPPASSFDGTHNLAFDLDKNEAGDDAYPQGNGFVTLNISSIGNVTWAGFMADGTPTTGSTMLGGVYYLPYNYIPLHFMMYNNTGSAQGWQQIMAGHPTSTGNEPKSAFNMVLIDGELDWMKIPQAAPTRSYAGGIPLHVLTSMGEENIPPSSGQIVLGYNSGTENAKISFSEGLLNPEFSQTFTINTNNTVTMPGSNPKQVKVTLNAATSKFSGNFVLSDPNPVPNGTPSTVTRNTTFNGVLLRRIGRGVGYFNLPALPSAGPPATTPATSPIWSGQALIEPNFSQQP